MNCPPEVAAILAEILKSGLLKIRQSPITHEQTQIEADHLHNLPELLTDYYAAGLIYYWDVERNTYLASVDPQTVGDQFKDAWRRLEFCVAAVRDKLD